MREKSREILFDNLKEDEKKIMDLLLARISAGRKVYGPWKIEKDKRDYIEEILMEVLDAMHYCAAQLLKLKGEE